MFRLQMTGGSKTAPCMLNDLMIYYTGEPGGPEPGMRGDVDNNGVVDIDDMNLIINIMLHKAEASDYPGQADVDGNGVVDIDDMNIVINIMLHKE